MEGKLYVVATPIGNLEDITLRALRVLKESDIIFAEDTRVTKKLLSHYRIEKPLLSYRQHSGAVVYEKVCALLGEGKTLALVTDAGTPGISDPGNQLVAKVYEQFGSKAQIIPIPGPSALAALASVSGISMDRFCFLGYPPTKKGRKKFFQEIAENRYPVIIYESPHRIVRTLSDLYEAMKLRNHETTQLIMGRELTKKFETISRGMISEITQQIKTQKPRGEYTVIVSGKQKGPAKERGKPQGGRMN